MPFGPGLALVPGPGPRGKVIIKQGSMVQPIAAVLDLNTDIEKDDFLERGGPFNPTPYLT